MYKTVLFGTFKTKLAENPSLQVITNIYQEPAFTNYYDSIAHGTMNGDLEYYLTLFKKNDCILEIGTGNGRVLKPLLQNGIDVYGIEPEEEMLFFLNEEEKNRVKVIGIDELHLVNESKKYTYIIIPATSVSLFDQKSFSNFLKNAKQLLANSGKILVDFLNPKYIQKLDREISIVKIENQLFMSGNFINENQFIYNIYTKTSTGEKKLGYSIKYIYTITQVKKMCAEFGYTSNVLKCQKDYIMMELINDAM